MKQVLKSFDNDVKSDRQALDSINEIAMRHCDVEDEEVETIIVDKEAHVDEK